MAVTTVFEASSGTSRQRETLSALAEQFDTHFVLWQCDGESVIPADSLPNMPDYSGVAPDESLAGFIFATHNAGHALVRNTADNLLTLAVPLPAVDGVGQVAVAAVNHPAPEFLQRHAQLVLEVGSLQRQLADLNDEVDPLIAQVAQNFEELSFFRAMAHRMVLPETALAPAEIVVDLLPELQAVAEAEGLVLILDVDPSSCQKGGTEHASFLWAGDPLLSDEQCQCLVDSFRTLAADRPVVKNHCLDLPEGERFPKLREFILVEIRSKGRHGGWLIACNRDTGEGVFRDYCQEGFTTVEATLLATAASMLAASFHNLDLLRQKEALFTDMIRALANALDARDPYTRGHSERVGLYARRLAQEIGLPHHDSERLYLTGLLHDIGKIAVPDSLLAKTERLEGEEIAVISRHPESGWGILQELDTLQHVLPGVLHHHEHFDGTGYPDRLAGESIPLDGRIVAVCDAYDAMTTDRPYRRGMPQEKAESILRENTGADWDPRLVAAFLSAMPDIIALRHQYRARSSPTEAARQRQIASSVDCASLPVIE